MDRPNGMELSRGVYVQHVRRGLAEACPRLRYAATLMGRGSEVLGYDDDMSTDHDWTARVIVLLDAADGDQVDPTQKILGEAVPPMFEGVPVHVEVTTVPDYLRAELGLETGQSWDACDWLSLPEHRLCAITSGAVFHDGVGLQDVRDRLSYYPRDVWYYLLASAWWRVHPEMNLVGRSGYAGDDLGSALIAADMVASLMHLAFLIERRYAPYRKWFGRAFAQLDLAADLTPHLEKALRSTGWQARERSLNAAYLVLDSAYDRLQITEPLPLQPVRLWQRPFTVPWADHPSRLIAKIEDPATHQLAKAWPPTGGVDRVRDELWSPRDRLAVRQLLAYRANVASPAQ